MDYDLIVDIHVTDSELFLMVCKRLGHSFVAVGLKTADNTLILTDVGKKAANMPGVSFCGIATRLLCSGARGDTFNDFILFNRGDERERAISYVAYSLSFKQYLEFLAMLKIINPSIQAYVPLGDGLNRTLKKKHLRNVQFGELLNEQHCQQANTIKTGSEKLSISNTCRNTAKDLASFVISPKNVNATVSSIFTLRNPLI